MRGRWPSPRVLLEGPAVAWAGGGGVWDAGIRAPGPGGGGAPGGWARRMPRALSASRSRERCPPLAPADLRCAGAPGLVLIWGGDGAEPSRPSSGATRRPETGEEQGAGFGGSAAVQGKGEGRMKRDPTSIRNARWRRRWRGAWPRWELGLALPPTPAHPPSPSPARCSPVAQFAGRAKSFPACAHTKAGAPACTQHSKWRVPGRVSGAAPGDQDIPVQHHGGRRPSALCAFSPQAGGRKGDEGGGSRGGLCSGFVSGISPPTQSGSAGGVRRGGGSNHAGGMADQDRRPGGPGGGDG